MASSGLTCPICVDSYSDPNDICSTICGHIFHHSCLVQWQEQSNTCPMCNRSNPAPHRLFIDLKAESDTTRPVNNGASNEEHKVIIKGIRDLQIETSLPAVVLQLIGIMQVHIREPDIGNISKVGDVLYVSFKSSSHKDAFLANKFKLKKMPRTSSIVIHEVVDSEVKSLFQYSHKLKEHGGFRVFYIKDKQVYVRKDKDSPAINILSKKHVDDLCAKFRNVTQPMPSTSSEQSGLRARRNQNQNVAHAANNSANTVSNDIDNEWNIGEAMTRAFLQSAGYHEGSSSDDEWREVLAIHHQVQQMMPNSEPPLVINGDSSSWQTISTDDERSSCWTGFKNMLNKLCSCRGN
uniref:RING-type domain-containing protein n=1 Tax=Stomoxys calcitrans TaxID=35570 RepID=A0A1I8NWB0_STOCA